MLSVRVRARFCIHMHQFKMDQGATISDFASANLLVRSPRLFFINNIKNHINQIISSMKLITSLKTK